jgi:hypothetical protein
MLMKDADNVYQPAIRDTVEQDVRTNGQFPVSGADIFDGAALPAAVRQGLAGVSDPKDIADGLILAPVTRGVLPDFSEIPLGGWG